MITILPVVIPVLFLTPVLQEPNGTLAMVMSFFPLFTPIVMLVRQASSGGIPGWEPWIGLIDVVVVTLGIAWLASRIFRVAILSQGKTPKLAEIIRWGLAG